MQDYFSFIYNNRTWAIGITIPVIIGLLGIIINHRLAVWRDKRNSFRIASTKFRNIIITELSGIYQSQNDWKNGDMFVVNKLEIIHPKLQVAVSEFKAHLNIGDRYKFEDAWLCYSNAYKDRDEDETCFHHYIKWESNQEVNHIEMFNKNIDNLLKYAKS